MHHHKSHWESNICPFLASLSIRYLPLRRKLNPVGVLRKKSWLLNFDGRNAVSKIVYTSIQMLGKQDETIKVIKRSQRRTEERLKRLRQSRIKPTSFLKGGFRNLRRKSKESIRP